jgi:hypothetical protein
MRAAWTAVATVDAVAQEAASKAVLLQRRRLPQRREQAEIIHDLFGNPFRPVTISPAVLAWNDSLVVRLAQAAYEERHLPEGTLDNGRLAILADALEEAGLADTDILDHLHSPGPHVRGCFAVDLCIGKS